MTSIIALFVVVYTALAFCFCLRIYRQNREKKKENNQTDKPPMMDLKAILGQATPSGPDTRSGNIPEVYTPPAGYAKYKYQTGGRINRFSERKKDDKGQERAERTKTRSLQQDIPGWKDYLHEVRMYKQDFQDKYFMAIKFRGFYLAGKQITAEEYSRYHETPFEADELILRLFHNEIREIMHQPSPNESDYPVGKNLEMCITRPLPLKDEKHLKNFVNYLLRTDRYQKWTNEYTPDCNMAFSRNPETIYTMGDYNNRILTRRILLRDAMQGIPDKSVSHLCMQVAELHTLDDGEVAFTDDECLGFFKDYIRRREQQDNGWKVLAYIEHSDGNGRPYHIHTLCRMAGTGD